MTSPTVRFIPWRTQSSARGEGRLHQLVRGSGDERVTLSLGVVSEEAANRYLLAIKWIAENWLMTEADKYCRSIGSGVRLVEGKGRGTHEPVLGSGGETPPPPNLGRSLVPPRPGPSPGSITSFTMDPMWLVEHARTSRDEVLRFLWATGEALEIYYASTDPAALPSLPPPDLVISGIPVPAVYKCMQLSLYFERFWAPFRSLDTPNSWLREKRLWSHYLLPKLGNFTMGNLNKRTFDDFITNLRLNDGTEPAGATRTAVRAVYKACLVYADRKGHIDGVHEFYRIKGATKRSRPIADILKVDEMDLLLSAASDLVHSAMFAFAFETGCRPSEVTRLRWEDIEWEPSARTPNGAVKVRGIKTDMSTANLPLGPRSRDHLMNLWVSLGQPVDGAVFIWKGTPIANCKKALASAVARAGIEKHITPYGPRHSCATHLMSQGVPEGDVAKWMRHSNPRMLREHYDHSEVADRVDVNDVFGKGS